MNYESRCLICQHIHPNGVMCPDLGKPFHDRQVAIPTPQLTELDVRRIVREELDRAARTRGEGSGT